MLIFVKNFIFMSDESWLAECTDSAHAHHQGWESGERTRGGEMQLWTRSMSAYRSSHDILINNFAAAGIWGEMQANSRLLPPDQLGCQQSVCRRKMTPTNLLLWNRMAFANARVAYGYLVRLSTCHLLFSKCAALPPRTSQRFFAKLLAFASSCQNSAMIHWERLAHVNSEQTIELLLYVHLHGVCFGVCLFSETRLTNFICAKFSSFVVFVTSPPTRSLPHTHTHTQYL